MDTATPLIEVRREVATPIATTQIAVYRSAAECDQLVRTSPRHRFDLSVTPRPRGARASWWRHWRPGRYEALGPLYVLPAGETMRFRSGPGTTTSIVCELAADALARWLEQDSDRWSEAMRLAALDVPGPRMRDLLLRVGEELANPSLASDVLIELLTAQIGIEFARGLAKADAAPRAGELPPWRLRLVDERLRDAASMPTIGELAALCRLSVRQLARGYRAARGHTIGEAIARERLRRARLMLESDASVKTIAHRLGFASPAGFAHAFRRASGQSPSEFRGRLAQAHG